MRKTSIRKTLVILGVSMLAIGLSACSGQPGGATSSGPPTNGATSSGPPTKLVIYSADPTNEQLYQSIVDTWGAQNNATVQIVSYPSASFMQSFTPAVNAKSQIDVLFANGQDVRTLVSNGLLADISGVVDPSTVLPSAMTPFNINNKQYAVGFGSASMGIVVYNKAIFTQYGLTVPANLDDVKADVAKLAGSGIGLISAPGGNQYLWPMWMMQAIQQTSNNTPNETTLSTLQSNQPPFTDATYVKAFQGLADLGATGAFANGYNGLSEDQATALFDAGQAAMFYGGTWDISTIVSRGTDLDIGVSAFPSLFAGAPTSEPVGGVAIALGVYGQIDSSRQALATQLVKYMASADVDTQFVAGTGSTIAIPAAVGVQPSNTSSVETQIYGSGSPSWFTFLDWYWPPDVVTAFQLAIPLVISGQQSPTDAANAIDAAFTTAKQNGWTPS